MSVDFRQIENAIAEEKKIILEVLKYSKEAGKADEKAMLGKHLESLKKNLQEKNSEVEALIERVYIPKKLNFSGRRSLGNSLKKISDNSELEEVSLKRISAKIKEQKPLHSSVKPNLYVRLANKVFFNFSVDSIKKDRFRYLRRDLVRSHLRILPTSYVSLMMMCFAISIFAAVFIFAFLLFFNLGFVYPFISSATGNLGTRILQIFWVLIAIPAGTFLALYFYPSAEKKALEMKINSELPFATIHMAAISEAMVNPSEIFKIIIKSHEYPSISKEFTKIINEVTIYGSDLVNSLRDSAFNNPSSKLADLLNGIATTLTSGGDLSEFFDKRSQTLLFEYRIEQEKSTRAAETFMDIYISVVIAAPMILMLLLMMMKISGLGISLSTSTITWIMVLGVSAINAIFLVFLQLRSNP